MIMKLNTVLVDELPYKKDMEVGNIYVSEKSWISTHLNPFHPEEEVITPHVRGGFRYHLNDQNDITITPNIHSKKSDISYQITSGYAIQTSY